MSFHDSKMPHFTVFTYPLTSSPRAKLQNHE